MPSSKPAINESAMAETSTREMSGLDANKKNTEPDKAATSKLVTFLKALWHGPDQLLLHLDGLLAPAENVGALLSTAYYFIRILGWFHTKAEAMLTRLQAAVSLKSPSDQAPPSPQVSKTGRLLWNARMTLRLFRLLPIYAHTRKLITDSKPDDDKVVFTTSIFQWSLYGISQLLENIAFLTECGITSSRLTYAIIGTDGKTPNSIYTLAYRVWFVAHTCDVVLAIHKAQTSWRQIFHQQPVDNTGTGTGTQHWWDFHSLLPMTWIPIGWQLSAWNEDSHSGFNVNLHNATSALKEIEKASTLLIPAVVS